MNLLGTYQLQVSDASGRAISGIRLDVLMTHSYAILDRTAGLVAIQREGLLVLPRTLDPVLSLVVERDS